MRVPRKAKRIMRASRFGGAYIALVVWLLTKMDIFRRRIDPRRSTS